MSEKIQFGESDIGEKFVWWTHGKMMKMMETSMKMIHTMTWGKPYESIRDPLWRNYWSFSSTADQFKMEGWIHILVYMWEIELEKLYGWVKQFHVYFNTKNYLDVQKVLFAKLRLVGPVLMVECLCWGYETRQTTTYSVMAAVHHSPARPLILNCL